MPTRAIDIRAPRVHTIDALLVHFGKIVLTANGRPIAVMTRVGPENPEEQVMAIRRPRARAAVSRMRARAKAEGVDRLQMDQIDAIVAQVRRERGSPSP